MAGAALAGVGASAIALAAAGAVVAAGLAGGVVAALTLVAATSEKVKEKYTELGTAMLDATRKAAEPIQGSLLRGVENVSRAFDAFLPTIERLSAKVAPELDRLFQSLETNAGEFGTTLERMFDNSLPSFNAFLGLGGNLLGFLDGFLAKIGGGGDRIPNFIAALGGTVEALGPLLGAASVAGAEFATMLLNELTPQIEKATTWIEDEMQPALDRLTEWFLENKQTIADVAIAIGSLVVAARGMAILGTVAASLALLTNPVGLVIAAVGLLAAGFAYLWTTNENFRTGVTNAWTEIQSVVGTVVEWFKTNVGPVLQPIIDGIKDGLPAVKQGFADIWAEVQKVDFSALIAAVEDFLEAAQPIADDLGPFLSAQLRALGAVLTWLAPHVKTLFQAVVDGATIGITLLRLFMTRAQETATRVQNALAIMRFAFDNLKRIISAKVNEVIADLRALPGRIQAALGNLGGLLASAGRALIQGLINGITSRLSGALQTVRNMASNIANVARSALGIASPSKVFRKIGEQVTDGLAIGLGETAGVKAASQGLSRLVSNSFGTPDLAVAGGAGAGMGAGNNYYITVQTLEVDSDKVERELAKAVANYERKNGRYRV